MSEALGKKVNHGVAVLTTCLLAKEWVSSIELKERFVGLRLVGGINTFPKSVTRVRHSYADAEAQHDVEPDCTGRRYWL